MLRGHCRKVSQACFRHRTRREGWHRGRGRTGQARFGCIGERTGRQCKDLLTLRSGGSFDVLCLKHRRFDGTSFHPFELGSSFPFSETKFFVSKGSTRTDPKESNPGTFPRWNLDGIFHATTRTGCEIILPPREMMHRIEGCWEDSDRCVATTKSEGSCGALELEMRTTRSRASRVRSCASKGCSAPSRVFARPKDLKRLCKLLIRTEAVHDRLRLLEKHSESLQEYLQTARGSRMKNWAARSNTGVDEVYLLYAVAAAGQHHVLDALVDALPENDTSESEASREQLQSCIKMLEGVERFYDRVGGILGYQWKVMEILHDDGGGCIEQSGNGPACVASEYAVPEGLDLTSDVEAARAAAADGLRALHAMGELYPLGGAGDRLGLRDEVSGEPLPVACLPYLGRSLLACLMRDVQARDYLHFCVFGTPARPPVAVMTSEAKGNAARIRTMFESSAWFGLGEENVMLFNQPMVPMVKDDSGEWIHEDLREGASMTPMVRPGGHGAIWKLLFDLGVAKWLKLKGRKAVITRQISNPLAGMDTTLLALAGHGFFREKAFGFMSCERHVGSAEGVNVMASYKHEDGSVKTGISNVEYTEFSRLGIVDVARNLSTNISHFPCNTNVLYVDLEAAESAVMSGDGTLPGMILNFKKKVPVMCENGTEKHVRAGRLECTMQNLADSLANVYASEDLVPQQSQLDTFLMFNARRRVTSSAKKRRKSTNNPQLRDLHQTPEGSFIDLQKNAAELLESCDICVPDVLPKGGIPEYLERGPEFSFLFHPALGPVWDVIRQKIHGGSISTGSEVELEIAELEWQHVHVNGSLLVEARYPVGCPPFISSIEGFANFAGGSLRPGICDLVSEPVPPVDFGNGTGRARLQNVIIQNRGIDRDEPGNIHWQRKVSRKETCRILLGVGAEFEASNVCIRGNQEFLVPDHCRMVLAQNGDGGVTVDVHKLHGKTPSWKWNYHLQESGFIKLELVESGAKTQVSKGIRQR